METRLLGRGGLPVSAMGFGAMALSGVYEPVTEAEAEATLDRAIELGFRMIDTADFYGKGQRSKTAAWGHNEELVGRCLRGRSGKIVLATKGGYSFSDNGTPTPNGRPSYIKSACVGSLQRLGVESIDLYYLHRVDPQVPIEDTVGAMSDLVREGKVRHIGLSEASVADIRRAHKTHPITALQSEYSLLNRDPETEVIPLCRELGIGFVAFAALARGLLCGAIREPDDMQPGDWRRESAPRFAGSNLRENMGLVSQLEAIAQRLGHTPAQLALAWILGQGADIVPLVGASNVSFLEESSRAAQVVLTETDHNQISRIFPIGAARGDRYPREYQEALRS